MRVKTVGRVSAYEAADDGLNMTWAPMVDVSRDPRWGRASEGFGEDTYLTTMMGQAMVESMQGKSPADRYSVMTSVKHFARLRRGGGRERVQYGRHEPAAPVQRLYAAV